MVPSNKILDKTNSYFPLLARLDDGPAYKRELAEELSVSKSTIYNWTDELQDLNIVSRTEKGYTHKLWQITL
ncbi:HTH domain-containing protein [Halogeometricum borinquense]|uniref:HTH domain-containing protein n=1 Tax=Halogeometricum borinquense TaxID=60847 RepID=A0A482TID0_9EURY|nr:HTH domain-containing protein [Halogeometricum borinquense]